MIFKNLQIQHLVDYIMFGNLLPKKYGECFKNLENYCLTQSTLEDLVGENKPSPYLNYIDGFDPLNYVDIFNEESSEELIGNPNR